MNKEQINTDTIFPIFELDNEIKEKTIKNTTDFVCPRCGFEDCYFNGVCYECPDCDYEWDCIKF